MKCCVGMTACVLALLTGAAAYGADDVSGADERRDAAENGRADSGSPAVRRPVAERFAAPDTDEVPDFRRHVVPVLGRLGCNSRACHGSFQGQGGFRLSLFGYDFDMDHEGLIDRVDVEDPSASYALHKAILEEPHRGGKRTERNSWEYNVLLKWIEGGAKNVDLAATPAFERLEVIPPELRFTRSGERIPLRVIAVWSDGSREDVTCLCRFQSNDDQIADVSPGGEVVNRQAGDTHIVAFYDNGVQPIPVLRPVTDTVGDAYPQVTARTPIDRLVIGKLSKLGIVPSDVAGDTEFLRRVSLDMTGTLPSPRQIREFTADTDPEKRSRKIDELLQTPAYAAWWATRFADWTGNSDDKLRNVTPVRGHAARDWYEWLQARISKNTPYDQIVEGLVLARGRERGEDYLDYCRSMSSIYHRDSDASYASRATMPHFWARSNFRQPEDRVIGFAYSFLGIRMQCAQCHKHPFDAWTMQDFHDFKNFFAHTNFRNSPGARDGYGKLVAELGLDPKLRLNQLRRELGPLLEEGKVVPFDEVWTRRVPARRQADGNPARRRRNRRQQGGVPRQARLLGESEPIDLSQFDDPREPLMAWLRSSDLMARALVNRVWAAYFHVGIVEPPDDLALANPPSNRPLLDYLTREFIRNGYDLKWLHREIASSDTYQRTWVPNETNRGDQRNFSHAIPRRMPAEVVLDALVAATGSDDRFDRLLAEPDERSIAIAAAGSRYNENTRNYSLSVFGRSIRESNCDCDRSEQPSLLQTVFLQNDRDIYRLIDQGNGGWLHQVARETGMHQTRVTARSNAEAGSLRRQLARIDKQARQAKAAQKKARKSGNQKEVDRQTRRIAALAKQRAAISGTSPPDGESSGTVQAASDPGMLPDIVRRTWLRTLSREPNEDELQRALAYIQSSRNQLDGIRDVLWALINTREFIVNH